LEKGEQSIQDLINKLDQKKDEAINTTFRMVAKNFSEVFGKIVPGGKGDLIMKTSNKANADQDEEGEGEPAARGGIRKYVGVAVNVRFAAGGEVHVMQSLSGGQKTVVALAIIFAIQKCDPAPFYLFDEVDANLDPMYRLAVAKEITNQKVCKYTPSPRYMHVCIHVACVGAYASVGADADVGDNSLFSLF